MQSPYLCIISAWLFCWPGAFAATGQAPCPRATLPAYAHNDYLNPHPLDDALRLGFRGVEADVFLVDGKLRLGHDVRGARHGATLETQYLKPLQAIVARCPVLAGDGRPFLLAIELKQPAAAVYDSLLSLLGRYRDLFTTPSGRMQASPPAEVALVGWHPSLQTLRFETDGLVRLQHHMSSPDDIAAASNPWVRLVSIDYGKTIGRLPGTSPARQRWLAAVRAVKRVSPNTLVRVHNLPADGALYAALLTAGVDLIGTRELERSRRILLGRLR